MVSYDTRKALYVVVKVLWGTVCPSTVAIWHGFEWPPSRIVVWCLMCGM